MFRRDNGVFYAQNTSTGKQNSLHTKDETEAKSLLEARNAAQRQPVLNLHLARAYLTASDPAFVERTWQVVMEQLQSRGKRQLRLETPPPKPTAVPPNATPLKNTAASNLSVDERLQKLAELFGKNLITLDEYDARRRKILDEI